EMTQQNSALVEQAAAAAGSMEDQARVLSEAVSAFRLRAAQGAERFESFGQPLGTGGTAAPHPRPAWANGGEHRPAARPAAARKVLAIPAVTTTGDEEWTEF